MGSVYGKTGEDLRFVCNLRNYTNSETNLTFTIGQGRNPPPDHQIHRINNSAIELIIPKAPEGSYIITCKSNQMGVALAELYVGHAPIPVTDFRCISINWEKLNCTFNFMQNPIHTNYSVAYSRQHDDFTYDLNLEPFVNATQPVYWFNVDRYKPIIENYTFHLQINNRFGHHSQEFTVSNMKSIRPDPPFNLNTTQAPGEPVKLSWEISYVLVPYKEWDGKIITEITYMSQFGKPEPIVRHVVPNRFGLITLANLYAHTWYDIRIRIRMSGSDPSREELWSDYGTYMLRTLSRIPDRPPETDIGAFSVNELNDVVIYWKELKKYEYNADNASYVITKSLVNSRHRDLKANIGGTMAKLQGMQDETLEFEVHSSNAKGLSKAASYVRVPRKRDRVAYPTELKKNRHGTIYTLTWREPAINTDTITSYTVFWCKSKSELPNQCEVSGRTQIENDLRNILKYFLFPTGFH